MIKLEEADLMNIPEHERDLIYIACETFAKSRGFDLLFSHLKNLYVSSTLGLNEINRSQDHTLITDEYFAGWLDMMQFLKQQMFEYSKAKSLSVNRAEPPTKSS